MIFWSGADKDGVVMKLASIKFCGNSSEKVHFGGTLVYIVLEVCLIGT